MIFQLDDGRAVTSLECQYQPPALKTLRRLKVAAQVVMQRNSRAIYAAEYNELHAACEDATMVLNDAPPLPCAAP